MPTPKGICAEVNEKTRGLCFSLNLCSSYYPMSVLWWCWFFHWANVLHWRIFGRLLVWLTGVAAYHVQLWSDLVLALSQLHMITYISISMASLNLLNTCSVPQQQCASVFYTDLTVKVTLRPPSKSFLRDSFKSFLRRRETERRKKWFKKHQQKQNEKE